MLHWLCVTDLSGLSIYRRRPKDSYDTHCLYPSPVKSLCTVVGCRQGAAVEGSAKDHVGCVDGGVICGTPREISGRTASRAPAQSEWQLSVERFVCDLALTTQHLSIAPSEEFNKVFWGIRTTDWQIKICWNTGILACIVDVISVVVQRDQRIGTLRETRYTGDNLMQII